MDTKKQYEIFKKPSMKNIIYTAMLQVLKEKDFGKFYNLVLIYLEAIVANLFELSLEKHNNS